MKINATQLPCEEAEFLSKLEQYRAARAAHKLTVGVPAPFPEFEIMRVIVERGEPLTIERDALQEQAKAVARDALAELDALKAEVAAIGVLKAEVAALKEKVLQAETKAA
jgi:hypothetical protein